MRFPSKVTAFNDSILAKFPLVLNELKQCDYKPEDLYLKIKKKLSSIKEFMEIVDCLYALNKIELIDEEVLHYVKEN